MKFSAKLRLGSYVDKSWKSQRRFGGVLHGVAFKKIGNVFESVITELDADQVVELQNHPDVELVMLGNVPSAAIKTPLTAKPAPAAPLATTKIETPAVVPPSAS